MSFLRHPSPKESSNELPGQPPSFAGHRRSVRRRRAHSRILARILARAGQDARRRNLSRHLERSTSRIPRARLHQAHWRLRHAIDPPRERPAFAADGGKRRQTAVRCGAVRLAAGARCCEAGPDRGISGRQVAELQGSAAGVPGQVGPAHHHADHRHRLQPAEDQDSAEELGCVVGSAIQGAGRAHGSEQPARHCLSRRDQPLARRERGELRAGVQGACGKCCRM